MLVVVVVVWCGFGGGREEIMEGFSVEVEGGMGGEVGWKVILVEGIYADVAGLVSSANGRRSEEGRSWKAGRGVLYRSQNRH